MLTWKHAADLFIDPAHVSLAEIRRAPVDGHPSMVEIVLEASDPVVEGDMPGMATVRLLLGRTGGYRFGVTATRADGSSIAWKSGGRYDPDPDLEYLEQFFICLRAVLIRRELERQ